MILFIGWSEIRRAIQTFCQACDWRAPSVRCVQWIKQMSWSERSFPPVPTDYRHSLIFSHQIKWSRRHWKQLEQIDRKKRSYSICLKFQSGRESVSHRKSKHRSARAASRLWCLGQWAKWPSILKCCVCSDLVRETTVVLCGSERPILWHECECYIFEKVAAQGFWCM